MKLLKDYLLEILNSQRFRDAYETFLKFVYYYSERKGINNALMSEVEANLKKQIEYIRTAHVINPMQMDELYANALNGLLENHKKVSQYPDIELVFQDFYLETVPLERYIYGDNYAVCLNIRTSDNYLIAFVFDMDELYPEYDKKVAVSYSEYFGLEDDEVLYAKRKIMEKLTLKQYLDLAEQHPTCAITIVDMKTKHDIIRNETFQGFALERKAWFWDE